MSSISVYTLTSPLHDAGVVAKSTKEFLGTLGFAYDFRDADYSDYGSAVLDLIYVRTGGTEGVFENLLPELLDKSSRPFYLLTSGKSNSLAASMEILSYLRQHGIKGEIIHGSAEYIDARVALLEHVWRARKAIDGMRLGVVGNPSDWLIASRGEPETLKTKMGVELVDVPMGELLSEIEKTKAPHHAPRNMKGVVMPEAVAASLDGAWRIYGALKAIKERYSLGGFTLRCFDLLTAVHNTGCIALAQLNSEGLVATCEGDVPAMVSMAVVRSLFGVSGFQANPAQINSETGELLFAHCTIPFDMVSRYELDTHFESGIGVGVRGFADEGPVTVFKLSGDLQRCFAAEGMLTGSFAKQDLCRTQQLIKLCNPEDARYFFTKPIGNHHIILPGHHKALIEEFYKTL